MAKEAKEHTLSRHIELVAAYFKLVDSHLSDLADGRETEMMELSDIAVALYVSHKHLIAIVKKITGHHPCHFYIQKILEKANLMLIQTDYPAAEIARKLSYDPSNFNKFYKKYTGMTPGQYRSLTPVSR